MVRIAVAMNSSSATGREESMNEEKKERINQCIVVFRAGQPRGRTGKAQVSGEPTDQLVVAKQMAAAPALRLEKENMVCTA